MRGDIHARAPSPSGEREQEALTAFAMTCVRRRIGGKTRTQTNHVVTIKREKEMASTDGKISNQGKYLGLALVMMLSVTMTGCYEGYIGTEGAPLLYYLPPENLQELVLNPDPDIWLIDVRPFDAYVQWHIPTAKSFPSSEVAGRLDELPKDKYLIVMCETGPRAQAVIVNVLEPNGYTRFMNYGASIRYPYGFVSGPDPVP